MPAKKRNRTHGRPEEKTAEKIAEIKAAKIDWLSKQNWYVVRNGVFQRIPFDRVDIDRDGLQTEGSPSRTRRPEQKAAWGTEKGGVVEGGDATNHERKAAKTSYDGFSPCGIQWIRKNLQPQVEGGQTPAKDKAAIQAAKMNWLSKQSWYVVRDGVFQRIPFDQVDIDRDGLRTKGLPDIHRKREQLAAWGSGKDGVFDGADATNYERKEMKAGVDFFSPCGFQWVHRQDPNEEVDYYSTEIPAEKDKRKAMRKKWMSTQQWFVRVNNVFQPIPFDQVDINRDGFFMAGPTRPRSEEAAWGTIDDGVGPGMNARNHSRRLAKQTGYIAPYGFQWLPRDNYEGSEVPTPDSATTPTGKGKEVRHYSKEENRAARLEWMSTQQWFVRVDGVFQPIPFHRVNIDRDGITLHDLPRDDREPEQRAAWGTRDGGVGPGLDATDHYRSQPAIGDNGFSPCGMQWTRRSHIQKKGNGGDDDEGDDQGSEVPTPNSATTPSDAVNAGDLESRLANEVYGAPSGSSQPPRSSRPTTSGTPSRSFGVDLPQGMRQPFSSPSTPSQEATSMKEQLAALKMKEQKCAEEKSELRREMEKQRALVKDREAELTKVKQELQDVHHVKEGIEVNWRKAEEELKELRADLANQQEIYELRLDLLQGKLDVAQKDLEIARAQTEIQRTHVSRLEIGDKISQVELQKAREKLDSLTKQLSDARSRELTLQQEKSKMVERIEELTGDVKRKDEEIVKLINLNSANSPDAVNDLTEKLADITKKYDNAQLNSDDDRVRADKFEAEAKRLEAEVKSLKSRGLDTERYVEGLEKALAEKDEEKDKLTKKLATLDSTIKKLKGDNESLKERNDQLNSTADDYAKLLHKHKELQAENEQYKGKQAEHEASQNALEELRIHYESLLDQYNEALAKLQDIESENIGLQTSNFGPGHSPPGSPGKGQKLAEELPENFEESDTGETYPEDDGTEPCPHCACPRGPTAHGSDAEVTRLNEEVTRLNEEVTRLTEEMRDVKLDWTEKVMNAGERVVVIEWELECANEELAEVRADLKSTKESSEELQAKLKSIEESLEEVQAELKSTKESSEELQTKLKSTEAILRDHESREEKLNAELEQQGIKLDNMLDKMEGELAETKSKLVEAESKLEEVQNETGPLPAQLATALSNLSNMTAERDTLKQDSEAAMIARDGFRQELIDLNTDYEELQQKQAQLQEELDTITTDRDRLQALLDAVPGERDALAKERDQINASLAAMTRERNTLQQLLTEKTEELGQVNATLTKSQDDLSTMTKLRDQLQKDLAATDDNGALLATAQSLLIGEQNEVARLKKALEGMEKERDEVKTSLAVVTLEREILQGQTDVLTDTMHQLDQATGDINRLKKTLGTMPEELDAANAELTRLRAALATITGERNQLRDTLIGRTRERDNLQDDLDAREEASGTVNKQQLTKRTQERDDARNQRDLLQSQLVALVNVRDDLVRVRNQLQAMTVDRDMARAELATPCPHCRLRRNDTAAGAENTIIYVASHHRNPIICWVSVYYDLCCLFAYWFSKIKSAIFNLLPGRPATIPGAAPETVATRRKRPSLRYTLLYLAIHALFYWFVYQCYLVYCERKLWYDANGIQKRLKQEFDHYHRQRCGAHSVWEHLFVDVQFPAPLLQARYLIEVWLDIDRTLPG